MANRKSFFSALLLTFLFACQKGDSAFSLPNSIGDVGLNHLSIVQSSQGIIDRGMEVFISKGDKWRSETVKANWKRTNVMVFDGNKLYVNSKKKPADVEYDLRKIFLKLFGILKKEDYRGSEFIGGVECWQFSMSAKGKKAEFWIDSNRKTPLKWVLEMGDGSIETDYFSELKDRGMKNAELFSPEKLEPVFLVDSTQVNWEPPF